MRAGQIPKLSVVATARNDNHGGNLLRRMQIFCDGIVRQAERHAIETELILVEWNPPSDASPLRDALRWKRESPWCDVRIVTVPGSIHNLLQHAQQLPLYQMIAKNVGVRRARGDFVLATNVDLLFEDELFHYLATEPLHANVLYRCDRYDVEEMVPSDTSIEEQLEFCRNNIIRIHGLYSSAHLVEDHIIRHYPEQGMILNRLGDRPMVHTNGCGDFQLMARATWNMLRGYPEYDLYSYHLDSVFAYQAYYSGVVEQCLGEPFRMYHIEHPLSGWKPEKNTDSRFEQAVAEKRLRRLTDEELEALRCQFQKSATKPITINNENWGLWDSQLEECNITQRELVTPTWQTGALPVRSRTIAATE